MKLRLGSSRGGEWANSLGNGAPGSTRTCDARLRRPVVCDAQKWPTFADLARANGHIKTVIFEARCAGPSHQIRRISVDCRADPEKRDNRSACEAAEPHRFAPDFAPDSRPPGPCGAPVGVSPHMGLHLAWHQSDGVSTDLGGARSPDRWMATTMRGRRNPRLDLTPTPDGTPLTFDSMARACLEDCVLQRYRTMNTARSRVEHLRGFLGG